VAYPTVVFYHTVVPREADSYFARKHPTVEQFAEHLAYLKTRFSFVSAEEFLALYDGRGSRHPKRPCLLTFDDGQQHLLTHALPVLEEQGVPCIIFVVAGALVAEATPWYICADYLVDAAAGKEVQYEARAFDCTGDEGLAALKAAFKSRYIGLGADERPAAIEALAKAVGTPVPALRDLPETMRFLTPEQVQRLAEHELVTVGSHALSHSNLATLSEAEQEHELARSFEILADLAPMQPALVSYPDGSHDATTRALARRHYDFGFAVEHGASRRERFAYPRICLGRMSVRGLAWWLSFRRRRIVAPLKRLIGLG